MGRWIMLNRNGFFERIPATDDMVPMPFLYALSVPSWKAGSLIGRRHISLDQFLTSHSIYTHNSMSNNFYISNPDTTGTFHKTDIIRKLDSDFTVIWVGMVTVIVGILLAFISHAASSDLLTFFSVWIIFYGLTFKTIWEYVLLYRLWKVLPKAIARTTPFMAIVGLFIPVFRIYWIFVAYYGLAKDMNKALQKRGIKHEVNQVLWLTYFVGLPVFFFKSAKDGAIVFLEWKAPSLSWEQEQEQELMRQQGGRNGSPNARVGVI